MTDFSVTWDYRCPFARNAHEHVIAGLRAGADWNVRFVPFSLGQVHVAEGEPDIWGRPGDDSGLIALQAGVVVRDRFPERFLDAHEALFALRHDQGKHLQDPAEVRRVLGEVGVDADAVFAEIDSGSALGAGPRGAHRRRRRQRGLGRPHLRQRRRRRVRPPHGPAPGRRRGATRTIERVVDLLTGFPQLNEFKHTSLKR